MSADPAAVTKQHFEKRCRAWGRHHYGRTAEFDFEIEIEGAYTFYACQVWLRGDYVASIELGPIGFQVLFSKAHACAEP